jgi:hypothetical protein
MADAKNIILSPQTWARISKALDYVEGMMGARIPGGKNTPKGPVFPILSLPSTAVGGRAPATSCSGSNTTTIGSNSEGSESADSTSFDFTTGSGTSTATLEVWVTSRVGYFDAGDQTLYGYARKLTFNCDGGNLVLEQVSGETRYTIDVPTICT